jgi:hypothetical protein
VVNIDVDEVARLVQRYLSTGAMVIVVLLGPGRADAPGSGEPTVATVVPGTSADVPTARTTPAPPRSGAPRSGPAEPADVTPSPSAVPRSRDAATGSARAVPGSAAPTARTTPTPALTPSRAPASSSTRSSGSAAARSAASEDGAEESDAAGADAAPEPASRSPDPAGGTTAAALHAWGTPSATDEFDTGTGQWGVYDGEGHAGNGRRSPQAVSVAGGILTITGDSAGTTGGMAWRGGQKYGRWEARVRAPAADPSYHAVLLLWPDAENWPEGGEIDFMEIADPARREVDAFIHYGADNSQVHGQVEVDATQWHNWAVEWTAESITTFVDGREWYRTTDTAVLPPGPMHLCVQLDWFPKGGSVRESTLQVDWVRRYSVGGTTSDTTG